ncbi:flavodoxin family protein [Chloroflexota bacterium]
MKILGIIASPRKGSSTDQLVSRVLEGAKSRNAEVEKLYLRDYNISHCQGAQSCEAVGACVIPDDMPRVMKKLREATGFVIGWPVWAEAIPPLLVDFFARLRQSASHIDAHVRPTMTPEIEKILNEEKQRKTCYWLWKGKSFEELPSPVEDVIFKGLQEYDATHGHRHPRPKMRPGLYGKPVVLCQCYW